DIWTCGTHIVLMSHVAAGAVTNPGLLWRWATDWRMGLSGLSNGILQLMHPGLGAGVADHSDFFADPWSRINRSLGPIVASIRDDETAHSIKEMHRRISGVDANGNKYHALNPEIFWWAHITLYRAAEQAARRFSAEGLSPSERESMYAEGVIWYQRYGVSDRNVPETCRDYTDRFRQTCTETLEMTPAAERAVDMALHGRVEGMVQLPRWAANPIELAVTPTARLTAIGGLPAVVRRRFDIPWSIADDLQYRSLIIAARGGSRLMPEGLKRISMIRLAERSRIPAGAMGNAA
ncbi:MAG TPA: oxygenase MpaB family protein, partial [Microthrixaceae bacterium]|nr:oxygenase MpaB family protein [Microthrixaceae bacterium]